MHAPMEKPKEKTILLSLPVQVHYDLRMHALKQQTSVRQLLRTAVADILRKGGEKKS